MSIQSEIKYQTPKQPRQLRLDTTTACNAGCLSCHRFLSKRKGEMPVEMIETILEDVSHWDMPLKEIVPVNYGEFFLRKDWYLILNKIAHLLPHTNIVIPTNGSRFTLDTVLKLSEIPNIKVINFSVNAYFDETYEAFMKLPASTIVEIRKAVAQLKVMRPDITLWVSMCFDPMYQSDLEKDLFVYYWTGHAIPQIIPAASAGRKEKKLIIQHKIPCRSIFSDMVIGYDGKISSCCWDASFSMDLGWLKKSVFAAWHSPEMDELRKLHLKGRRNEIELCSQCTYA